MAQTLNIAEKDMEMTNALKFFGNEIVDLLYPDNEKLGRPYCQQSGRLEIQTCPISDSVPLAIPEEMITFTKKI